MNTRTVGPTRCRAPVCATLITAVSAWAFFNSTACCERDPFQFASTISANADAHVTETAAPQSEHASQEVAVYTPPDLLAVPPPCLGSCA